MIVPFAPGGADRLRAFLKLLGGNLAGADKVGSVHDMRFVFFDNDTRMIFATTYDGDWDPYIDDFATKIPDYPGHHRLRLGRLAGDPQPGGEGLPRQAPGHGRRLVRRQRPDGGGDAAAAGASVRPSTSSSTRSATNSYGRDSLWALLRRLSRRPGMEFGRRVL